MDDHKKPITPNSYCGCGPHCYESCGCCGGTGHNKSKKKYCKYIMALCCVAGFAVGPIFLSTVVNSATKNLAHQEQKLILTGIGEKKVKADRAKMTLTISHCGNNIDEVMSELDKKIQSVIDALKTHNIKESMISKQNINTTDMKTAKYVKNVDAADFTVTQELVVSTDEVDIIHAIQKELLDWGYKLTVHEIRFEYFINKMSSISQAVANDAVKQSQDMAKKLAGDAGLKIGKIY